jgi:aryl-alcohol dehydrogenase-like predicted oxidoreductase
MAVSSPSRFDLDVHPLCLGGNVFGWTADKDESFAVLDAFVAGGGNFIDTADVYSAWIDGNSGGESETILGAWMASRGNRDDVVLATKVAKLPGRRGLGRGNIELSLEESLQRLETHYVDLYWCHEDDEHTPMVETFETLNELVEAGKIRRIGLSNYTPERIREAVQTCDDHGWAPIIAIQPKYSLVERGYEHDLRPVAEELGLGCTPYYALASGFLAGKYRPDDAEGSDTSPRAGGARKYLERDNGAAVLAALDQVAAAHDATVAAVSLAWLLAQPTVVAPIASARTPEQLADLLPFAQLQLTDAEVAQLSEAAA